MLVLGATGFAGRHLRPLLEDEGWKVTGTSRTSGDAELTCDLTDPASVEQAIRSSAPDAIVNLGGLSSVSASWDDPVGTFAVNTTGTVALLDAVSRHVPQAHVVCVSSGEVYGDPDAAELPLTEEAPLRPTNPYGASKAAMEMACGQAAATGRRIAVVRAFNHLGPGQDSRFAAASFARQIAEAQDSGADEVTLAAGNLSPRRDFTDVRDMVRVYAALLGRRMTGTFNACSGRAVAISELVEQLRSAATIPVAVRTDPDRLRPADAPEIAGSAAKLHAATGWEPRISLDRTMADLLASWNNRGARA
ncbi:MAG: GDP-mannose 4,6-dehydratase [Solirubrobacterales bacterium]